MNEPEPTYRQPPHSFDAEQALLGAILVSNAANDRISGFLEAQHFFDPLHRAIYETAVRLICEGKRADPITLKPYFDKIEPIRGRTGPQYLADLALGAATTINVRDYARTIYEQWQSRELIRIGEDMVNAGYERAVDFAPKAQIEEAEARLYSLAETDRYGQGFSTFDQTSVRVIQTAEAARKRGGGLSGIATKFADIDAKLGGLQASDLVILAGRPSMGKTALATNIALNVARAGVVVGFFSLEMSDEQLATRVMAERAGIPSEKIRRGLLDDAQFDLLSKTQRELAAIPLHIDQSGGLSIAQLAGRARRLKRKKGLGLVIVDYLQLMTGGGRRNDGRVHEVTEITTGLKALAKELHVPVLALSQLNRDVEKREDKRPQLADLRESGSIEQDADIVLFVYREEYYLERECPTHGPMADWVTRMQQASGKAEIIISKQRHRPIGIVPMQFDASLTRFSDLALSSQEPRQSAPTFNRRNNAHGR